MMYDLGQGILREDLSLARGRLLEGKVNFALQALDAYITLDELLDLLDLTSEDIGSRADGEISDIRTKAGIEIAKNYAPNQPRDAIGRFASSGSSQTASGGKGSSDADVEEKTAYKALYDYQDYAYSDINNYLRITERMKRGKEVDEFDKEALAKIESNPEQLADTKSSIEAIDKVFTEEARTGGSGHRIDNGIAVDLFASTKIGQKIEDLKKAGNLPANHDEMYGSKGVHFKELNNLVKSELVGKSYIYDSYVSTDSERSGAYDRFASGNSKMDSIGMETYVNVSSSKVKTIRVNDITGMDSYNGQDNPENEILFNRGSQFEIYNAEIIPTSADGYAGTRGHGFQLALYMKDSTTGSKVLNYSPTQPRDSLGRFASAGSYGSLGPSGFIDQVRADYKDTLTAEQKIEVMSYTDSSYQYTNPTLREVRGDISKLDDYRKETVKQLDSAMIHKLKGDTELYRGVDIEGQFLKGDVINNFGYSSTTFGKDTAEKFAIDASGPKSAKVLTIKAKAGQKGLIPAIISDNDVDVSLRGQEKEYLLPRNLKLKVTDTKQRTGDVNGDKFKYTEVITEIIK